jgi:hypothetical protein
MNRKLAIASALCAAVIAGSIFPSRQGLGDEPKAQAKGPVAQEPKPKSDPKKPVVGDLLKALKESPGCIGIETAMTSSGKQVIFAWFKDKKAVTAWYRSRIHQELMGLMDAQPSRKAMAEVKDDDGPVLVITSITPSAKPKIEGFPMPISQISIELYKPLPGGAAINGTFAPKTVEIPGIKTYTIEPEKGAEAPK